MELIFIRHGQGEHTLDIPSSLQIKNPSLTPKGVIQAQLLRNQFPLTNKDIVFISPIRRTLQTAFIWSENIDCSKIVSPLVSPRMFPILPDKNTLPCDKIIDLEIIKEEYPTFEIDMNVPLDLWADGINVMLESKFLKIAEEFITDCKLLQKEKIYIVSHDGTITSYRQLISGQNLTRKDFPYETGWFQISC
ncbi:histidine phosphatase family protein [Psychrobacillus vulpis]|uniref:Histidine phosphatase family protein n=1 Tax=Psychrobacillus vulpis TaxID=2325572 RepID=A0A544TBF2_9BACI|nr:histidine phosphatase family protein [Psychrobacillus vulpis]TQR14773.1 histidine phosphatase family protein [Psychrobacillus vulpis]